MPAGVGHQMEMRTEHLDMNDKGAGKELRELVKHIDMAMLTTWDGHEMRSRPMSTQSAEADGELWFMTRIQSGKVDEMEHYDKVNVSYSDPNHMRFVSVSGTAKILVDPAKARELWTPHVSEWSKGPDDPELALVSVTIDGADWWDSEGRMTSLFKNMRAAVMGHPRAPGESAELTVSKSHLADGERRI